MDDTQFIFDTSDGVMAVDGDQRITLWNGGSYALLGFKPEEVMGRYCYEVLRGRDESGRLVCQAHCRDIMAMRRQELVRSHDILVHTKAGRELWVNVSTIRVPSRRKDLTILVHLFRDATRQKEMERFVKNLLAGVEKLSSFRGAASATASSDSPNTESLTNREREVLRLLFSGSSTETIAHKLGISPATARNHITRILGKLDVHSRLEAVTLALRNGLI